MIFKTIQGTKVPALGLGTYRMTGRACREGVKDALSIGYRHVDTAQSYKNEEEVGRALAASDVPREDIFLTTKIWRDRLRREGVRSSTEESLRKLQTDFVDLLLIHWPSDEVPLEETLDAMQAMQAEGRARHIGVSNFPAPLVQHALRHTSIFCNQVEYHPFLSQQALRTLATEYDFLLTAYSPIARGQVRNDATLQEIAAAHGRSPEQISLRWLVQQDKVAAIPKAADGDHRRQNFAIFDFELSKDEMRRMETLARGSRIVNPAWAPTW